MIQMDIENAKALCVEAHKGQFRRPIILEYFDVSQLIGTVDFVPNKYEEVFSDGRELRWEDLNENWELYVPYHTHPFAVADMMDTDDEKIAALLHDVIEDTNAILAIAYSKYLIISKAKKYELSLEQYVALQAITKGKDEPTEEYLLRVAENKLATKVKIADMFHNMSSDPTEKQKQKYLNGIKILLKEI